VYELGVGALVTVFGIISFVLVSGFQAKFSVGAALGIVEVTPGVLVPVNATELPGMVEPAGNKLGLFAMF
jgi:hypothetical protein